MRSWRIFAPYLESKKLTVAEAEEIINKRSFTEDNKRFRLFLKKYPLLSEDDIKKIISKNFRGFGRLSQKFLTEPVHPDPRTGSELSIINMMWEENLNLQQLLSDSYSFKKMVEKARKEYYAAEPKSLTERLDSMYVSNAVKRPIIRTLTILDEITRTMGKAPRKIFVEMARDVDSKKKGQRTESRLVRLQKLYQQIADEDSRRLSEELKKHDESALQRDVLYLYFMQLGRDMYTEESISVTDLSLCNKEHIYPQSKVKDDSLLNNIVLVNSKDNGEKSDSYPLNADIRKKMTPFWKKLLDYDLITPENFFRLTRSTPFSADEKWGFINRQLVETRQSTKVLTELLKERYPESEVVYVKAGLVSDFRNKFDLVKSRTVNDLHHAKDAYLNIVVGDVYHTHFTRKWFRENAENNYSIKTETVFSHIVKKDKKTVTWQKEYAFIEKTLQRNYMHLTNYTYCQHGGFFNQNPVLASEGLIPLKKGLPTEIYGGYNKTTVAFFVLALTEAEIKKKILKELNLVSVDLMIADKFLREENFAVEYVKKSLDSDKKKILKVGFPLGIKPIRIKTIFEIDNGLRFALNGKCNGGKNIIVEIETPLLLNADWEKYIKYLENFSEKKKKNPNLIYSESYDKFSAVENVKLYDILTDKLQNGVFSKRPNNENFRECLITGRSKFTQLSEETQAELLLDIIHALGRDSKNSVNLKPLGGKEHAGKTVPPSNLSGWKKHFTTVRIVYSDASGLHETKSINLLDLI